MMMLMVREPSWWFWLATTPLLWMGLAGVTEGYWLALALSAFQVGYFRLRDGAFSTFPVQVRIGYTLMCALFLWEPLNILFWIPAIGTPVQVLFGYCTLARCLSLLPWNRKEPMSAALVWRTFVSRPVRGSILQGLPAVR
jgi:hypothetical protein